MMPRIKLDGAIFDLDGTLLDSMSVWDKMAERYLESHDCKPRAGLREDLRPLDLYEAAVYLCENYDLGFAPERVVDDINNELDDFYRRKAVLKSGVKEFLQTLKSKGKKLAVATATDRKLVDPALERNGIHDMFDYIVTCPDVKCSKERPDIYLNALGAIKTEKENTPVFEDALFAIKTAKAAGFPVVGLYEPTAEGQRKEIINESDLYSENILDVLKFIEL